MAAGTVGCTTDRVDKLIPYLNHPDNTVAGVSNYYATTCRECAAGCGVVAEVRDGRAIKLEGSPEHPLNAGGLCSRGQAALQGLYNPDRYRGPMRRDGDRLVPITWDEALQELESRLAQAGSLSSAVFINQHESGTFPVLLDEWLESRGMPRHVSVDAELHMPTIQANREVYGVAWPSIDFTAARLIVSVGADFLDGWGALVPQQLSFADARGRLADAPRFVYVGARRSLTGLNSDQWISCRPGTEAAVLRALAGEISAAQAAEASGANAEQVAALAAELRSAGSSVVLAGTHGADAVEVSRLAARLNQTLGNVGRAIRTDRPIHSFEGVSSGAELQALTQRMSAGQVPVIFVRGANPVFTSAPASGFAEAFAGVPFKVSFSSYPDETAELCDLVLPDHHSLESWGAAQPLPGVISMQQPVMNPVFNTRSTADVLLQLGGTGGAGAVGATPAGDTPHRRWLAARFPGGVPELTGAIASGLAQGSVPRAADRPAQAVTPGTPDSDGDFFLHVYASPLLGAGAGGNKPWLQELSDPVTKLSWQSWVEIHPVTAERMGVENGDHLTVTTGTGSVTAPAYLFPGLQPDTVAIALGRGHTAYGRYAKDVGINPLIALSPVQDATGGYALAGSRCTVTRTGTSETLVTTEGSARQHGRGIAQALTAQELRDAEAGVGGDDDHHHDIAGVPSYSALPGLRSPIAADAQGELADSSAAQLGMYDPDHWSGMARRRWAMTVDLARCTGCSACVTACYAENNIPTVGAPWQGRATSPVTWDERPGANIMKGREMTWIRIERYYEGETGTNDLGTDFETRFVPMMCQHCGNAPCEPVCPVFATYHAPDGLNVQVYNRCVGTRYCSNNCPYKVRYYNWFGYGEPNRRQYAFPEPLNWQLNPDVTIRGKGVMEKCSFCVQRIREAEHLAASEQRDLNPDEFTVACAQACPSRAIVFGDAADATWSVAQLAVDKRAYHVFEDLSTFTAVVYLKKVNHPAPAASAQA